VIFSFILPGAAACPAQFYQFVTVSKPCVMFASFHPMTITLLVNVVLEHQFSHFKLLCTSILTYPSSGGQIKCFRPRVVSVQLGNTLLTISNWCRQQRRSVWWAILGRGPPLPPNSTQISAINRPNNRKLPTIYAKSAHSYLCALTWPILDFSARSATGRQARMWKIKDGRLEERGK
jgi:hypothetical protein